MKQESWESEFKNNASYRLDESLRMIKKSLNNLDEADIWKRPNPSSNSVGNLMLHLCGNISQYMISSLDGRPDNRDRDSEFAVQKGLLKKELLDKLEQVISHSKKVLAASGTKELIRIREVQGFQLSGIGIVMHVVEHLSYHTGQIAYWTKLLKDKDLGFYEGYDLNLKNPD